MIANLATFPTLIISLMHNGIHFTRIGKDGVNECNPSLFKQFFAPLCSTIVNTFPHTRSNPPTLRIIDITSQTIDTKLNDKNKLQLSTTQFKKYM
jgi:hypothetical protein